MAAIDKISNKVTAVPLQSGWVIFMVIALVLGIKLKWFRARLRFNDQPITNSTSVLGVYRPTLNSDNYFETRPNITVQQNVPQTNAAKPIDKSISKSVPTVKSNDTDPYKKKDAITSTSAQEAINPKYEKRTQHEKLSESIVFKTVDKTEKQKTKPNQQIEIEKTNEKQKTKPNQQINNEKTNEKQKTKHNQVEDENKAAKKGKKTKAPASPVKKEEDTNTEVENWAINIVQTNDSKPKIQSSTNTGVSYSGMTNPATARTSTLQFSQAAASIFMMDDDTEA